MRSRHRVITAVVIAGAVALAGASAPLFAGGDGTTTNDGGKPPDPPDGTASTTWNPTNVCAVSPGESIQEFLACLASWIDDYFFCRDASSGGGGNVNPPPGIKGDAIIPPTCPPEIESRSDYKVHYIYYDGPDPNFQGEPTGFSIVLKHPDPAPDEYGQVPDYAYDPYHLRLHEASHNITETSVRVGRPNLYAKIHRIIGTPAGGGSIVVSLNNKTTTALTTTATSDVNTLNNTLLARIRAAGFSAIFYGDYILVSRQTMPIDTLHFVSFKCTDTGLYESTIMLTPDAQEGDTDTLE